MSLWEQALQRWELDDWSMPKEMFAHIVRTFPQGSRLLEFGSGATTALLASRYEMISVENCREYIGLHDSQYLFVPLKTIQLDEFPDDRTWFDPDMLEKQLRGVVCDGFIIDGPRGERGGLWRYRHLFQWGNKPIFFDDVMEQREEYRLMKLLAADLGRGYEVFPCAPNPKASYWFQGKAYGVIYP